MSSEPTIGVSLGTAHVLGLANVFTDPAPTTAYLLVGGRCHQDCAFCAQARGSSARPDALSRVLWPACPESRTLDAIARAWQAGGIQRACLQVTAGPTAVTETARLAEALRSRAPVPICASVYPNTQEQLEKLLAAGIEVAGFGLDAATPAVYATIKAPGNPAKRAEAIWYRRLALAEESAQRHPRRIGVHLIAGLGETEREMIRLIDRLVRRDIIVALFAFTPVRGTPLEDKSPPDLASYRRLQAARHLLVNGLSTMERFAFGQDGVITGYGMSMAVLRKVLSDGAAFQTSGCPGCNRPYYNERPGGTMYNYPRPLTPAEVATALVTLGV